MDANHIPPKAATPAEDTPRARRRAPALTIPEQIASRLAAAIVNGEYKDGERLREQELAASFGVSRGPVREALRALERYGLAILLPRRGAYVVGLSLDVIAEAFNVRAALAGIAARQLARRGDAAEPALAEMAIALEHAAALVDVAPEDSHLYQAALRETSRCIYRHSGAGHIDRALTDQVDRSIWGLMWRQPLDFRRRERRVESLALWRLVHAALVARDEHQAETLIRRELLTTRDSVVAALGAVRGEAVDPALMFRD